MVKSPETLVSNVPTRESSCTESGLGRPEEANGELLIPAACVRPCMGPPHAWDRIAQGARCASAAAPSEERA
jgi:hypothetical protein